MMQRYDIDGYDATMIPMNDGEWVKADIAEELYEVVSHLSVYRDSIVPNSLIDEADKVLKKVRGEGE